VFSLLRESYPTILIQRSSEDLQLNPTVLPNSPEKHSNEESHTPTTLRHRENIGRIGSLRVFWQMSVIDVFPLKTGDSMFVGFDSQNTSHLPQKKFPSCKPRVITYAGAIDLVSAGIGLL
jgi:hypothetical protein